jgi:hypothetical protein
VVEKSARFTQHPTTVKLTEKLNSLLGAPILTRKRMILAVAIAVTGDVLQCLLLPFAWTFAESAVDCIVMILTVRILGFHPLLLPTFVVEFIPVVDMLPTWTACVIAVIVWRRRDQRAATRPVPPEKPVIDI